jgi:inosine/xanthosine triphosphatase
VRALRIVSGVKAFPSSDEETLHGALNRARKVRELEPGAEFAVGLEGGLSELEGHRFVKQVAVVIKDDNIGIGVSQGYIAPVKLLRMLDMESDESREIIDAYFGRDEILSDEGAIGALTRGVLNRTIASRDAVICALTRFVNPQFY